MFVSKITKKIIKNHLSSFYGVFKEIQDEDISVIDNNVVVKLSVIDQTINYLEVSKMMQKKLVYELNGYTDSKDYVVDIIIGEN